MAENHGDGDALRQLRAINDELSEKHRRVCTHGGDHESIHRAVAEWMQRGAPTPHVENRPQGSDSAETAFEDIREYAGEHFPGCAHVSPLLAFMLRLIMSETPRHPGQ